MLCSISFTLGYYNIQSYWKPYMAQFMNLKTKTKIWTAVPWNEKPVCYHWAILMSFLCFTLFRSPDLPKSGGPRFGRSNLDPASLVEVMRLKRCFWEIGKLPHVSCTCIPENEKKIWKCLWNLKKLRNTIQMTKYFYLFQQWFWWNKFLPSCSINSPLIFTIILKREKNSSK